MAGTCAVAAQKLKAKSEKEGEESGKWRGKDTGDCDRVLAIDFCLERH